VIGKEEMDGFFSRLLDDASKRVATHEKLQVSEGERGGKQGWQAAHGIPDVGTGCMGLRPVPPVQSSP
jgi:hypothetical protein